MQIPFARTEIPFISTDQMREVDRAMVEDFEIELLQMMENAGRNLAHLARIRFFLGHPESKRVTVMAGTGGNGGGALVAARRLHNWGAQVQVVLTRPAEEFTPAAGHQLGILRRMGAAVFDAHDVEDVEEPALMIDGLIGYSLKGAPRGGAADLIHWANSQNAPILALDTPSGLDTQTGKVFRPAIRANATMTLALPKEGLRARGAKGYVGELYLADISVPPALYRQPGLALEIGALFSESEILRLW